MSVDWVQDGRAARVASDDLHALVLLDPGLPKQDELSVLRALHQKRASIPVIIFTASDALEDQVTGLDLGADDYPVTPFPVDELMARMRAGLRRHHRSATLILGNEIVVAQFIPAVLTGLKRASSYRSGVKTIWQGMEQVASFAAGMKFSRRMENSI